MTGKGLWIAALSLWLGVLASPVWAQTLNLSGPEGQTATLSPADVAAPVPFV